MNRPAALLNWLVVDHDAATTLYEQIANQIRDAIIAGQLEPGIALPATRAFCKEMRVSRITVVRAYEQLRAEGFLDSHRGAHTRVSPKLSNALLGKLNSRRREKATKSNCDRKAVVNFYGEEATNLAFQPGIPAYEAFPRGLWSRILSRQALKTDPGVLDYSHVGGYGALRREVANYLCASRGVNCDPQQVVVVSSVRSAIASVCAVCWTQGSRIAVEDPGYVVARKVLKNSGCRVFPVKTDSSGLCVQTLINAAQRCDGAYLTPAHHWPTGVTLTAERRLQLLDWSAEKSAWIIEDDYDSEFRFDSLPLGTLHALDTDRVIYVGTFSKTLAPSLRTAYLVVPHALVQAFEDFCFLNAVEPPLHVQAGLAEFMAQGHFIRHIGRMRKLYMRKRKLLVDAISSEFGKLMEFDIPAGGLQIIARLPDELPVADVVAKAAEANIFLRSLTANYVVQRPSNSLHIGFAAVPEEQIETEVSRLADVLKGVFEIGTGRN